MAVPALNPQDTAATFSALAQWKATLDQLAANDPTQAAALTALQQALGAKAAQTALDALVQIVAGKATLADLATEATTRGQVDSDLSAGLSAEQANRNNAVNGLAGQIVSLGMGLSALTQSTGLSDENLQRQIGDVRTLAEAINTALSETANNVGDYANQTNIKVGVLTDDLDAVKDTLSGVQALLVGVQASLLLKADAASIAAILAARRFDFVWQSGRPGDAPLRYTVVEGFLALGGARTALPVIPDGMLQSADHGPVVRMPGGRVLAAREVFAIEIARIGRARFAVQRRTDPVDPSGDAVTCALVWLDQRLNVIPGRLGYTIVQQFDDLRIADGRQAVEVLFSRDGDSVPGSITAPANARFAVPAVFTFGPDGITDVEVLGIDDVTSATVLAPETQDTVQRVGAIESKSYDARIAVLEQSVGTPGSMTFPSRAAAAASTVPANIQVLTCLGTTQSGDGGDGLFLRSAGALGDGEDGFLDQGGAVFRRVTVSQDVFDNYMAPAFLRWASGLPRTPQTDTPYIADGFLVVPR